MNPESMIMNCPALCGVCTNACVDKHDDCGNWATGKDGKACELDSHLPALCPASCGICAGISVRHPPDKEEL